MQEKVLTRPHKRALAILDQHRISYEVEKQFGTKYVDIYLPDFGVAIEIDGPFHNKRRDAQRDAYLFEQYGLRIVRIQVKTGWINVLKDELERLFSECAKEHHD